MSLNCTCPSVYGNTGLPGCQQAFGVARDFWLVPIYDSTGAKNTISTSDLVSGKLPQAFFIGKFNDNDDEDRFYPIRNVEQYNPEKAEPNVFTYDSGNKERLSEGSRTFSFFLPGVEPAFIQNLEQSACGDLGIYVKDEKNNILGDGSTANESRPMRIARNSMNVDLQLGTDGQPYGVMVSFDLEKSVLDTNIRVIGAGTLATDVDFEAFGLQGLVTLNATISAEATTGFTAAIDTQYGDQLSLTPFVAGALADFYLYNETTDAVVTITGLDVTNAATGVYVFTYIAQTSADVLGLYVKPETKNGYELLRTAVVTP